MKQNKTHNQKTYFFKGVEIGNNKKVFNDLMQWAKKQTTKK